MDGGWWGVRSARSELAERGDVEVDALGVAPHEVLADHARGVEHERLGRRRAVVDRERDARRVADAAWRRGGTSFFFLVCFTGCPLYRHGGGVHRTGV